MPKRGVTGLAAVAVVVTMALLAACAPRVGRPAVGLRPNAPAVWDNADPAVFVWEGVTYLYGTNNNVHLPVRRITDLTTPLVDSQVDWATAPRDAMPTRPAWVDPTEWDIWAPSVVRIGGVFAVYFASKHKGPATDEFNDLCIGRADATSPMGPFIPWNEPVYCGLPREGAVGGQPPSNWWGRGALDPEVFVGADGQTYMLVALSRTKDNIGVVRLDHLGRVVGGRNARPAILATQGLPWHDGTVDSTLRGHVFLENPSMVYDEATRTYLLFYSAGAWDTPHYVTGFARCAAPTGPCSQDTRGPFLRGGPTRSAPGGLTVFRHLDGVLRVAYATWTAGFEGQVGPVGEHKRQTHWATLEVSSHADPARQTITLGPVAPSGLHRGN